MSIRDLSLQPSLRHLKQEAKQFHKALQDGDPTTIQRVRSGLPRLNKGDAVDDVTLMEAQHVLVREYGYREWPALAAAAEFEFETLSSLSDEDTQRLLRQVDQKDLVIALKLASEAVKDRMLCVMSERVRNFITEEMELLGPMPVTEIREVQSRILDQIRRLDELDLDGIRVFVHGLSFRARNHGIMSLETAAKLAVDGFVKEALQLAVDGTEPALIEDLMKTRTRALLQHLENRQRVIHEGIVAICGRDNPRIVAHKLVAVYRVDFDVDIEVVRVHT